MVYETYLPELVKISNCTVISHLRSILNSKGFLSHLTINQVKRAYEQISNPSSEIASSLLKLINVKEVAVIEGRK